MKEVRLSALNTGRLYFPRNILDTHFCQRLSRSQGHSAAGRIMSMKNSNDTIEPATFRLIAQCLNQLRHRLPLQDRYKFIFFSHLFKYSPSHFYRSYTSQGYSETHLHAPTVNHGWTNVPGVQFCRRGTEITPEY